MKTYLVRTVNRASRATVIRPITLVALFLGLLGYPGRATAQSSNAPPSLLSYQGYLVDANGNPLAPSLPANYAVVFRIYDAASGGTRLWSEQQVVTVDKGNFSVVLGEGAQYPNESRPPLSTVLATSRDASDRYIGITVTVAGTDTVILPRLRLLPTPYAFLATSARNLTDPNGKSVLAYNHDAGGVQITGDLYASGSISGSGSGLMGVAKLAGGNGFTGNQTISSGRLGIGTTSPQCELDIVGANLFPHFRVTAASSAPYGAFLSLNASQTAGGKDYFIFSTGGTAGEGQGKLVFKNQSDGKNILTLSPNGNVGVGTTSPQAALHVSGDVQVDNNRGIALNAGDYALITRGHDKFTNGKHAGLGRWGVFMEPGSLVLGIPDESSKVFSVGKYNKDDSTYTTLMQVGSNGRVGIGTTSPQSALHVVGDVKVGTEAYPAVVSTALSFPLRIVSGRSGGSPGINVTGGYSIDRQSPGSTGDFKITFNPPFKSTPVVTVTPHLNSSSQMTVACLSQPSPNSMTVTLRIQLTGAPVDSAFDFIAMGPK